MKTAEEFYKLVAEPSEEADREFKGKDKPAPIPTSELEASRDREEPQHVTERPVKGKRDEQSALESVAPSMLPATRDKDEARMEERLRDLENLKAAKLAGEEAAKAEEAAGGKCPGCGKLVGWDNLPIDTELPNLYWPLPFRLKAGTKGKRCPSCGYLG